MMLHVLRCGEVGVDPAVPFRDISKNPVAYTGLFRNPKRRIWIPVCAYLIEHPRGNVLVDTGWHTDVRTHPIRHESFRLWFASKPQLPDGEAVTEQLDMLGLKPQDLEYVVLTHMDIDHVSGLGLVKGAQNIMASGEELKAAGSTQVRYCNKRLWAGVRITPVPFEDTGLGPVGKSFDVFGDDKVQIVSTPGHAQGSMSVLAQENGRFVLLTGDTGYAPNSWEQMRLPGPVYDKDAIRKSLSWVKEMAHKENCAGVFAVHDPAVRPQIVYL